MNDKEANALMQTLYVFWICDFCKEYCATWNKKCDNPLHKIHEWAWEQYK